MPDAGELVIRIDDLQGPEIRALLEEHLASMHEISPPGGVQALDLDSLRTPGVTFWSLWAGDALAGCGALQELDPTHGEIKSMRTATTHRRQGVASACLTHLLEVARERNYRRVSLETGNTDGFAAARALYSRFGFERCGPFGSYVDESFSYYMTLDLGAS